MTDIQGGALVGLDVVDSNVDSILVEVVEVESHLHSQNKVYGIAAVAPLIASRGSTAPLTVTGGNATTGTSMLISKGSFDSVYFDPSKVQISAVSNANSPTLLEFYSGVLGGAVAYTGEADDDVITASGHGLSNGDRFIFDTLNNETYGVTTNVVYFARDVSGTTFKVEATSGGGAINITTDISGNIKKISSPTLKTEIMISMAATNADAQTIEIGCPRILSAAAFWVVAKSKSGDTTLVSFFLDIHNYAV
jgi:hypothetical protein